MASKVTKRAGKKRRMSSKSSTPPTPLNWAELMDAEEGEGSTASDPRPTTPCQVEPQIEKTAPAQGAPVASTSSANLDQDELALSMDELMSMLTAKSLSFTQLKEEDERKQDEINRLKLELKKGAERQSKLEVENKTLTQKNNNLSVKLQYETSKVNRAEKKIDELNHNSKINLEKITKLEKKNLEHAKKIGAMAEGTVPITGAVTKARVVQPKKKSEKLLFIADPAHHKLIAQHDDKWQWDVIVADSATNIADLSKMLKSPSSSIKGLNDYGAVIVCLGLTEMDAGTPGSIVLTQLKKSVYRLADTVTCPIYLCQSPPISIGCNATMISSHTIFNYQLEKMASHYKSGQLTVVMNPDKITDPPTPDVVTSSADHTLLEEAAMEWLLHLRGQLKPSHDFANDLKRYWDPSENVSDSSADEVEVETSSHEKQVRFNDKEYKGEAVTTVVPHTAVGKIIGKGGKMIRHLEGKSDTDINKLETGNDKVERMSIVGTPIGIAHALVGIRDIIRDLEENERPVRDTCVYYAQGRCRNGHRCQYSHDAAAEPSASTSGYRSKDPRHQVQRSPVKLVKAKKLRRF